MHIHDIQQATLKLSENLELLTLTLTPDDSDGVKEVSEKQLQIGGGAATPQVSWHN